MTNGEVARVFEQLATMLEMDGANPFRVRAYREAARVVGTQAEPITQIAIAEGRLESMQGIGKDLAQKIREVAATGSTAIYDEMKAKYPVELVALTELQGVGPKRVRILFDRLQVRNREDLESAAKAGKLKDLPGFGETLEKNVLKALESSKQYSGRILLSGAWSLAAPLGAHIGSVPGVERVEPAGSFRRRKDTIGDLDFLVCGGDREQVMTAFTTYPGVVEVLGRGDTKSSVRLSNGLQVDLRLVPIESFGAAMLYFTGSKAHNIELRKIAIDKGLMLNEYGLMQGEKSVAGRTEEDIYRALGMSWIPPELREAHGEIARARSGTLPKLIEESDLRADLHMHTDRTDGRDSLEAMVRAARDRGYAYCAITDHSKALAMARGFNEERVRQSIEEIAAVRKAVPGITVLHGLEVDILADGSLDLDDWALELLDWVLVSLHSRLDQPEPVATERVLRAISHPAVSAMAHPTGRMIGSREPARFDMEKVLDRAAELGVLMEINAQPHRTDLNDVHARQARERGVGIVIDTDAHSILELDNTRYGVFAARRAGLTREDVLNAAPYEQFLEQLKKRPHAVSVPAGAPGTDSMREGATKPKTSTSAAPPERKSTGADRNTRGKNSTASGASAKKAGKKPARRP